VKKIRILLFKDEAIILSGQKHLVKSASNYVTIVLCGHKASEMAGEKDSALVISDLIIPDMNGVEVCRQVKARYPDIEALLVTGDHDEIMKHLLDFLYAEGEYITEPPFA
jgi:CheY-like chemotaxis protein